MRGQRHARPLFTPGKELAPICTRVGGPQGRSEQVRKISPSTGIRSPHRPARSQSLYRLRYPAHWLMMAGNWSPSMSSYHNELFKNGCDWRLWYSVCLCTCHSGSSHPEVATVRTEPFSFHHSQARDAKNSKVSSLTSSQVPRRPECSLMTLHIEQKHTELIEGRSGKLSWLGSLFVI